MLENVINYSFRDKSLLNVVLGRKAAINEGLIAPSSHEMTFSRLKFLGTHVLDLLISHCLFSTDLFESEGSLTQVHSKLFSHDGYIVKVANKISLGDHLIAGHGEKMNSHHTNDRVLHEHMQVLFGAIWYDCHYDFECTNAVFMNLFSLRPSFSSINRLIDIPEGLAPPSNYHALQSKLGYAFTNMDLLFNACIRQSALEESMVSAKSSFQVMEYLGDNVLGCVIANYLVERYPHLEADELVPMYSMIVSNATLLPHMAKVYQVGAALIIGNGEELQGVRKNTRKLADHMEALIAAVWLDSERNFNIVYSLYTKIIDEIFRKLDQKKFNKTASFPPLPRQTAPKSVVSSSEKVSYANLIAREYQNKESKQKESRPKTQSELFPPLPSQAQRNPAAKHQVSGPSYADMAKQSSSLSKK